jgi:hypothetical protein
MSGGSAVACGLLAAVAVVQSQPPAAPGCAVQIGKVPR